MNQSISCTFRVPKNKEIKQLLNFFTPWAVVVMQLAELSLPSPEDPGLNPIIGNFYRTFIYCSLFVEKMK